MHSKSKRLALCSPIIVALMAGLDPACGADTVKPSPTRSRASDAGEDAQSTTFPNTGGLFDDASTGGTPATGSTPSRGGTPSTSLLSPKPKSPSRTQTHTIQRKPVPAKPTPPNPQDGQLPASRFIHSGDSVFFVGNSFMGGDDERLAVLVSNLGQRETPPFVIQTGQHVVYGNQPLSWFFQQPDSQDAIASGKYKVFVLQGEDREPVDHPDDFKAAVKSYYDAVTAHGGTIMLFMTWDFPSQSGTTFFQTLSSTYDAVGAELHVPVIPIGLIYEDCYAAPYDGEGAYWLMYDAVHQNDDGRVVNTYATYAMLTGMNPNAQPFSPRPMADDFGPPALLQYLSEKVWARVAPRLSARP